MGFRVSDLGFRVWVLGLGFGLWVCGLGFLGFRVYVLRLRV